MKCASGTAGAGTSPWPCWPRPFWRWLGIRRPRGDRVKRPGCLEAISTPDGAVLGPPAAGHPRPATRYPKDGTGPMGRGRPPALCRRACNHHEPWQRRVAQLAWERKLLAICRPFLSDPSVVQGKLCRRRALHQGLFVFVAEPDVPSDNNPAERSLRHLVISRKISGGTRSEQGTESKMTHPSSAPGAPRVRPEPSMKCASGTAGAGTSPWPCWPRPFWRWLGIRRPRGDRVKRGLPRRGGRADTDDGARGAPIALPAGLDALPPGGFGVGLVSVETPTSGQSPALSLSTPPQTSGIICATVVLD